MLKMRGAGVFVPHFINIYVMPIWNVSLTDIFGSAVPPPGGIKEPNIPNMLAIATNEAGLDSDQKINMTNMYFWQRIFSTQSLPSIFAFSFVIYFSSVAAGCYPLTFMVSNEPVSNIFPIVQLS